MAHHFSCASLGAEAHVRRTFVIVRLICHALRFSQLIENERKKKYAISLHLEQNTMKHLNIYVCKHCIYRTRYHEQCFINLMFRFFFYFTHALNIFIHQYFHIIQRETHSDIIRGGGGGGGG